MATRGFEHVTQQDITRRELKQALKAKPSKYHNIKVQVDGHTFDSKREAAYWVQLRMREKAGEIQWLRRQVPIPLYAPDMSNGSDGAMRVQICTYVCDFDWYDRTDGKRHIADAKGVRTQLYALKARWLFLQEGITIEEV